jgi:hypothetical protein
MGSDGFKIGTVAANGVVTLKFGEDLPVERRKAAAKLVLGVRGVTRVVSVGKAKA